MPPGGAFVVAAGTNAVKTDRPLAAGRQAAFVARINIDGPLLHTVDYDLISEGNTVGWAGPRTFHANLADIFHAHINGLINGQGEVRCNDS